MCVCAFSVLGANLRRHHEGQTTNGPGQLISSRLTVRMHLRQINAVSKEFHIAFTNQETRICGSALPLVSVSYAVVEFTELIHPQTSKWYVHRAAPLSSGFSS